MSKAKGLTGPNGGPTLGYVVMCPGCKRWHLFDDPVHGEHPRGSSWVFNGDLESPTFTPSMLVNKDRPNSRCHSIVTNGRIEFLNDCYHELAGKTVDLPDVDFDWIADLWRETESDQYASDSEGGE